MILDALATKSPINSSQLAEILKLDHQIVVGGIKSLQQIDGVCLHHAGYIIDN